MFSRSDTRSRRGNRDENESIQDMLSVAANESRRMQDQKQVPPQIPRRKYLSDVSDDGDSVPSEYRARPLSPSNKIGRKQYQPYGKSVMNTNSYVPPQSTHRDGLVKPVNRGKGMPEQQQTHYSSRHIPQYEPAPHGPDVDMYEGKSFAGDSSAESQSPYERDARSSYERDTRSSFERQAKHGYEREPVQDNRPLGPPYNPATSPRSAAGRSVSSRPSMSDPVQRDQHKMYAQQRQSQKVTSSPYKPMDKGLAANPNFSSSSYESSDPDYDEHERARQLETEMHKEHYVSQYEYDGGNFPQHPPRQRSASTGSRQLDAQEPTASFRKRKELQDAGGELAASSVGANVRVNWNQIELARLHFAAIHLRWSVVSVLSDAASKNQRSGGYMVVDLSSLERDGKQLFTEDFPSVFGEIFKACFVPSVHEKFNHQGGRPSFLPKGVADSFKLLVLCERLDAILKDDVMRHIQALLQMTSRAAASVPAFDTPAYTLLETSLEFAGEPPVGSMQESVINTAIEFLVGILPESLPALEKLVSICVANSQQHMAKLIFRETTEATLKLGTNVASEQTAETIEYMRSIKNTFGANRDRNHIDIFAELLVKGNSDMQVKSSAREIGSSGLAFEQGVLLRKHGNGVSASGPRIVRLNGNYLEWKKLKRKLWQPEKRLHRENITAIARMKGDESSSFRIRTRRGSNIVFTAQTSDACRRCVETLLIWLQKKNTVTRFSDGESIPAGNLVGGGLYPALDNTPSRTLAGKMKEHAASLARRATENRRRDLVAFGSKSKHMPPENRYSTPARYSEGARSVAGDSIPYSVGTQNLGMINEHEPHGEAPAEVWRNTEYLGSEAAEMDVFQGHGTSLETASDGGYVSRNAIVNEGHQGRLPHFYSERDLRASGGPLL